MLTDVLASAASHMYSVSMLARVCFPVSTAALRLHFTHRDQQSLSRPVSPCVRFTVRVSRSRCLLGTHFNVAEQKKS